MDAEQIILVVVGTSSMTKEGRRSGSCTHVRIRVALGRIPVEGKQNKRLQIPLGKATTKF